VSDPKKFEQIILSPIILLMLNVSHEKDNHTPTAYLLSFFGKDNDMMIVKGLTVKTPCHFVFFYSFYNRITRTIYTVH
jgi:hypothetical protein